MEENQDIQSTETNYSRRSRKSEDRELSSRKVQGRSPLSFENISQFNLPESLRNRRSDTQFIWSTYMINSDEYHKDYDNALRRGFVTSEASSAPELVRYYKNSKSPFKNNRDSEDDIIRRGGQILMERPIELREKEMRHYREEDAHNDMLVKLYSQRGSGMPQITNDTGYKRNEFHPSF